MRILQIDNSLGTGGVEKLILDTVPLYRKAGIEMDVLLLWDNDLPFTKALKELDCCNVFILKKSGNDKDVYNPAFIFKIKEILKNYDIAHLHVFPSQYYAVFANLLNGGKTKLILTEHNTSNKRIANKIFKPVERFVYNRYDKIICISEEIKKIYQNYLNLPDKLVTINNGVDINKIIETQPYSKSDIGYSEEDRLLIMVARFTDQKDQDTIINSLVLLPERYKLLLVGDGHRREELEKLAAKHNVSHRVNFLGQRMDVPKLLKTSDFVILSSHYEGLSLSSVEGMASGKPFIASDVPGLTNVVRNAGLLFEAGNAKQLSEIILDLDKSEDEYENVVKKCLDRAKEYDIKKMVNKYIEVYESVFTKQV
jgi:glycosyltransferase involved in cell wall biosynthesis